MENKPASLLVVSLGKALNGTPPPLCGRVTRRGGKEALDRRKIGEDERQPVMARLGAEWRRSNLSESVVLRKGNHPGEAYVRRG